MRFLLFALLALCKLDFPLAWGTTGLAYDRADAHRDTGIEQRLPNRLERISFVPQAADFIHVPSSFPVCAAWWLSGIESHDLRVRDQVMPPVWSTQAGQGAMISVDESSARLKARSAVRMWPGCGPDTVRMRFGCSPVLGRAQAAWRPRSTLQSGYGTTPVRFEYGIGTHAVPMRDSHAARAMIFGSKSSVFRPGFNLILNALVSAEIGAVAPLSDRLSHVRRLGYGTLVT
jgi:hypothetical protein